mmetsp:Transcript_50172/g.56837  ORF Transcript_50172/g.56837 Transcript_50172/m.56837 type:complete len:94 (+) Transcript_50172:645-926(+)
MKVDTGMLPCCQWLGNELSAKTNTRPAGTAFDSSHSCEGLYIVVDIWLNDCRTAAHLLFFHVQHSSQTAKNNGCASIFLNSPSSSPSSYSTCQ